MTDGWNSWHTFPTPPGLTSKIYLQDYFKIDDLLFILLHWNARSHRQDVCFRPWFILVVEAHRAVGTKKISVPGSGGIPAFDAVRSAASHHFALDRR